MTSECTGLAFVMPGLKREARLRADVPGIHALLDDRKEDVDGRDKPGHDGREKQ
jgi:hypothetical protein